MKIAIAVDELEQGNLVLQAVRDLRFRESHLRFAHVVEIWDGADIGGVDTSSYSVHDFIKRIKDLGRTMLQQMQQSAEQKDCQVVGRDLLLGNISNELIEYVDKYQCDLLALGSYEKGPLEGILEGSVGRKAVISCKKSVLIVKPDYKRWDGLSVVLATDHSHAANRWIQQFIHWAPAGLSHIHLLSVIPEKLLKAKQKAAGNMDVDGWIRDGIATQNQRVLLQLKELGVPMTSHIEQGDIGTCIAQTMRATQSKLLVLGSQGHGFMERLTIGSVALEQVTHRPYSVLVVRT